MSAAPAETSTRCCIVGGGPCGMMLGVLLARAGIDVVILEKYPDFFRDFRGDTIHPSTLQLLYELGWLDEFLALPHNELAQVAVNIGGQTLQVADFSALPTHCKFIAFMPQWDFLNFLAERGRRYPGFHLEMQTNGVGLIEEDGRVCGVRAIGPADELTIRADLVVGTDGRRSTIRKLAGFEPRNIGAPMDVLWMRVPKHDGDSLQTLGTIRDGRMLVTLDRGEYWQCAYIIGKGAFAAIREAGLPAFRAALADIVPQISTRFEAIDDWSKVSLLEVRVDRLDCWHRRGLLCLGDAAHAMSPIGGIGINLAVQDAVAAANELAEPLLARATIDGVCKQIQRRRMFPTKVTQAVQVFIQDRAIDPLLQGPRRSLDRRRRSVG